jgi:hypothetical protein
MAVSKAFKNSGVLRFHRKKTKKHWKHFFIDSDDGTFHTEWVSSFKAMILKRNVWKKRWFICDECEYIFQAYTKKVTDNCECPECEI